MNLIWFLLRASGTTVVIAVFIGSLSGACSALLIALINKAVSSTATSQWSFIKLAVVALLTGIVSQYLLVSLSQSAVYKLRLRMSSWILACSLRHLEELGANRILATLTDDVQAISGTVFSIPFLCVDIALILGGFVYLGWLSWVVFLGTLLCIAAVIALVHLLLSKARFILKLAREQQD